MRLFIILLILCFSCHAAFATVSNHKKLKNTQASKIKHITKQVVERKITITRTVKTVKYVSIPKIYGDAQLSNELNRIIGGTNAHVAVYVKSMHRGDALYTRNINTPLMPASTLKVMTAEAALIYLGPEYRFSTQLLTDAKDVKDGILQGNLYLVLSGDPTLTYYNLIDLLMALRSQQIKGISGNVYIDNTAYDGSFYGPGWPEKDKQYCYGAPISASIINHNCISFQVSPNKNSGRAAQVVTFPRYFYPTIKNGVITKARSRSCGVHLGTSDESMITIEGCVGVGRYAWGVSYVVSDVPEYSRALVKNLLQRLSVKVSGNITFGTAPDNLSLVSQHGSKPLRLLINDMLKKSDNIIASALFKKMGQLHSKAPGSWENASAAVAYILNKFAKVNTIGLRILDGSGLSPQNQTTPAQMMQVLDFAYHHNETSFEFVSALPVAGVDGTLKHRMSHIARKVRAKTGTISGVVSLAGYAVSAEKEPLAFVIMINGSKNLGWQYKALEDQIVTALTRYRRSEFASNNKPIKKSLFSMFR